MDFQRLTGFIKGNILMENIKANIIPYNQLAEQSVLGAMILNKDAVTTASQLLKTADFYVPAHSEIFEAILDLFNLDQPIDIITLSERLKLRGSLDSIGGTNYLVEIANMAPTSGNLRHYATIITEKSTMRRLIHACEDISKLCYSGEEEVSSVLDLAEQRIFEILENKDTQGFTVIGDVLSINYNKLLEMTEQKDTIIGVTTGFESLDRILNGLQKQNFVLIAARPAMGKTSLALNIAQNAALKQNAHVAIFSLEMSKEELVNRMWSSETFVDVTKVQTGDLEDREWTQLLEGMDLLSKLPIYIDDTGGTTVTDIRAKARRLKRDKGLDLIIIDHMQLMTSGRRIESRQQEISEISRHLKLLAKDLDIPVMTLSQLNRTAESRSGNRPVLSDLRESGAIEQDADLVMMIYRDDYYNKDTEKPGVAECIIAKHRNGPTGVVELKWQSKYTRFSDLESRYDEE